jgi:hypothetical protein
MIYDDDDNKDDDNDDDNFEFGEMFHQEDDKVSRLAK